MKRLLALVAAAGFTVFLLRVVNGGADPGSNPGNAIDVVERATTDTVTDVGPVGDSAVILLMSRTRSSTGRHDKVGTDQVIVFRT